MYVMFVYNRRIGLDTMNKAKNYLYSRLNILYGEKQILISKIRNIEIEIKEIEGLNV